MPPRPPARLPGRWVLWPQSSSAFQGIKKPSLVQGRFFIELKATSGGDSHAGTGFGHLMGPQTASADKHGLNLPRDNHAGLVQIRHKPAVGGAVRMAHRFASRGTFITYF